MQVSGQGPVKAEGCAGGSHHPKAKLEVLTFRGGLMDRRIFMAAGIAAAGGAGTALAQSETPLGATGVPLPAPGLPLGPLPGSRYPDPHIESLDKRFPGRVGSTAVERVATGFRWAEGPAYFSAGRYLIFSDIPNNRLMRLSEDDDHLSVFRAPAMNANGNTVDRQGRLVTCEHSGRRVTRTEFDGAVTVLADRWQGKRLNSPNDLTIAPDGSIWFTDPTYGIEGRYEGLKAEREQPGNYVYRIDPVTGQVTKVLDGFDQPNGICFSPDGKRLYVIDSGAPGHIRVFDFDPEWAGRVGTRSSLGSSRAGPMACAATSKATSGAAWAGAIRRRTACAAMRRTARCSARSTCPRPVRT